MKRIIATIALLMSLGATLYAQLPSLEWRIENEKYLSTNAYQFDVNLYNTGGSSFEILAGTFALMYNTDWLNGGSLGASANPSNITFTNYGLVTAQQSGITNTGLGYFYRSIPNVSLGSGTIFAAGSKKKMFTVTVQNVTSSTDATPVDFLASAAPNFAWKFDAIPFAGLNYNNGGSSVVAVSNIVNNTSCYNNSYWTGSTWSMGSSTTLNTSVATAPSPTIDCIIYNGVLFCQDSSYNTRNFTIIPDATFWITTGQIVNVYGNIVIDGGFLGITGGKFALCGTGSKTISGTYPLILAGLVFRSTGTYTSLATIVISENIEDFSGGGFTFVANNPINLESNPVTTNTACVGKLSPGTSILGTIHVERYIPANGRRWRFLSSPVVGGTTLQWRDNGGNNFGSGINITGTSGTVDFNVANPSALSYNEASAVGGSNINAKWEAIDGNSVLSNGRGYRVFIRGDRSDVPTNSSNHATNIWVEGTYPGASVSIPVTYNASLGDGWNLVGNPYPCQIDWNAASGWTKTNISGTIWIWNPITNSYGSFDGFTSINSVTNIISVSQAFFVKATGINPSLIATEQVKGMNGSSGSEMFKADSKNSLRIKLVKDATESDETVVRFMDTKSDEFTNKDDVVKPMMNPSVNISSFFGTDKYAMINYMNTKSMDAKVIPLSGSVAEEGTYDLNFNQVDGFDANINIYLKDNYNNTITDLRQNSKYAFNVDSKAESTMDGRLELIFVNKTSSIESVLAGRKASMSVYPNPAIDVLNIEITNANFKHSEVSIFNVSGVEVVNNNMIGNKKSLDVQKVSSGVYFVRVSNSETGYSNTVKFVK